MSNIVHKHFCILIYIPCAHFKPISNTMGKRDMQTVCIHYYPKYLLFDIYAFIEIQLPRQTVWLHIQLSTFLILTD